MKIVMIGQQVGKFLRNLQQVGDQLFLVAVDLPLPHVRVLVVASDRVGSSL